MYGNYNKQDFSNTSGRLVAKYNLDDNTNFYASYTTGYRAGGFNGGAFNRATGTGDDYTEETIASFEVGVKSTLLMVDSALTVRTTATSTMMYR